MYRDVGRCPFNTYGHQSPQTRRSSLRGVTEHYSTYSTTTIVISSSVTSKHQVNLSTAKVSAIVRLRSSADHQRQYDQYKTILEKCLPHLNEWPSRTGFSGTGDLICMMVLHVSFLQSIEFETLPRPGNSLLRNFGGVLKSEMKRKP